MNKSMLILYGPPTLPAIPYTIFASPFKCGGSSLSVSWKAQISTGV